MTTTSIGWAEADLTPEQAVCIAGQFHARISEGAADPITATVLILDTGSDCAAMVSCDLVAVGNALRDTVRARTSALCPELDTMKILFNATHTHTGPVSRTSIAAAGHTSMGYGIELDVMPTEEYIAFAAERIAQAIANAWSSRQPGEVAFGLDYAVIGRNRRSVDTNGVSAMYGNTDSPTFSHIEGYEDHSLGVLATRNSEGALTGLVVNVPCPSQVDEGDFVLSADYWFETRQELRHRFGKDLFILPQCGVAGDQSPHLLYDKAATERMFKLQGRTERQVIAQRIANAVEITLGAIETQFTANSVLKHVVKNLELPLSLLTENDVQITTEEADQQHNIYLEEKRKLEADPELRNKPRWYMPVTRAYRHMMWCQGVRRRFEAQERGDTYPAEVHILRLGDAALATIPFEYYLDFGIFIKARSKAIQTFLVQQAGAGTYVPSRRSVSGGGYGSKPASNPVGPEGGQIIAEEIVAAIEHFWAAD